MLSLQAFRRFVGAGRVREGCGARTALSRDYDCAVTSWRAGRRLGGRKWVERKIVMFTVHTRATPRMENSSDSDEYDGPCGMRSDTTKIDSIGISVVLGEELIVHPTNT